METTPPPHHQKQNSHFNMRVTSWCSVCYNWRAGVFATQVQKIKTDATSLINVLQLENDHSWENDHGWGFVLIFYSGSFQVVSDEEQQVKKNVKKMVYRFVDWCSAQINQTEPGRGPQSHKQDRKELWKMWYFVSAKSPAVRHDIISSRGFVSKLNWLKPARENLPRRPQVHTNTLAHTQVSTTDSSHDKVCCPPWQRRWHSDLAGLWQCIQNLEKVSK